MGLAVISGAPFNPRRLFISDAVKGAIYDYDDFAYLYQKADGSIPITALEQPVGLMLDKRFGGAVSGTELRSTGTVSLLGTATAATYNTATGEGSVTRVDAANQSTVRFTHKENTFYRISVTNGGPASLNLRTGGVFWRSVASGASVDAFVLSDANGVISLAAASTATVTFTVSSIRELPGLHAYQTTDAARPVLSARYNLLLNTVFAGGAAAPTGWTQGVGTGSSAPGASDGVNISYVQSGAAGERPYIQQSVTLAANSSYTATATVHEATGCTIGDVLMSGSLPSGNRTFTKNGSAANVGDAIASGDSVTMVLAIGATGGSAVIRLGLGGGGPIAGAASIRFSKPDLRLTADANGRLPAYQRVETSTSYDAVGFPRFLRIDATDDFMQTAAVGPGTDKVFVCAGVTKMSDAAAAILLESSANSGTVAGSFAVFAPQSAAANFGARSGGTTPVVRTASGYTAPSGAVLSMVANISADTLDFSVNGLASATATSDQGTGNYTAQPIYIGARAGTTLRLNNGRIYPMVICFKLPTAGEISATEQWLRARCPANF